MFSRKGQASSIYTYIGVFLVAVFALFLFVTQSGNQAQNLRTMVTTDTSLNSQLRLRGLFTRSYPVAYGENMKISTAISYACLYGKKNDDRAFTISKPREIVIAPERFLESYLNETISSDYRMEIDCGPTSENLEIGEDIPDDADVVISSQIEFPLAKDNRSEISLMRW